MALHRRLGPIVLMTLALVLGACGTATTTPTSSTGAVTTPATTNKPAAGSPQAASQILVGGLLQRPEAGSVTEYGIYSVDSSGANLHRLSPSGTRDYSLSWSPDGQHLTFTRLFSPPDTLPMPKSAIVVMDADGTNERMLTDSNGSAMKSVWSPDGRRIAFQGVTSTGAPVVSVMNADGSNLHDVGPGSVWERLWSPDGSQLVFQGPSQTPTRGGDFSVYVANADGSNLHAIVGPGLVGWPVWSPDGTAIAYVSMTSAQDLGVGSIGIWAVNPDGTNPRQLSPQGEMQSAFFQSWSPDGKQLAFIGGGGGPEKGFTSGLYVMNADGSNLHQLVQGASSSLVQGTPVTSGDLVLAPSWSPDGREIAFLAMPDIGTQVPIGGREPTLVSAELRVVAIDGSARRTLVSPLFVEPVFDPFDTEWSIAPVWRPTGQ